MDNYDWQLYASSHLKKVVDHLIRGPLMSLLSLSRDQCLLTEIIIFRKNLAKISSRLRNSKISSLLIKINRSIQAYLNVNVVLILETNCTAFLNEKYITQNGNIELPTGESIIYVMKELQKLVDILDSVCKYSSYSVSHCMLWLRLGHMIPHFIICLSTISRLNIISRALLIYIADLYNGLREYCRLCKSKESIRDKIALASGTLKELCSQPDEVTAEFHVLERTNFSEDLGQIIDRKSQKVMEKLKEKCREKIPCQIVQDYKVNKASKKLKRRRVGSRVISRFSSLSVLKNLKYRKRFFS